MDHSSLFLPQSDSICALYCSVGHGHHSEQAVFKNPPSCEAIEFDTPLQIACWSACNAFMSVWRHGVCGHRFVVVLTTSSREYSTVLFVVKCPLYEEIPWGVRLRDSTLCWKGIQPEYYKIYELHV